MARPAVERLASGDEPARLGTLIYLALISLWVFLAEVLARALDHPRPHLLLYSLAAWSVVGVSGALLGYLLFRRLEGDRRARASLGAMDEVLRSIELVTEPELALLSLGRLLDELLERVMAALAVDVATIYLVSDDHDLLTVRASLGLGGAVVPGVQIPVGRGLAGRVAGSGQPVVADDVSKVEVVTPGIKEHVTSLMAAPLTVEGRVIGVVQVGTRRHRSFTEGDLRLLQLVGDRVATAIERARLDEGQRRARMAAERAREQLTLLTEAEAVLASALDEYEPALTSLGGLVVPAFADWFTIELEAEEGRLRRAVSASVPGLDAARLDRMRWADRYWNPMVHTAMEDGRAQIIFQGPAWRGGGRHQLLEATGFQSLMIVPIKVRDDAFGALVFATTHRRRGYRLSDQATAEAMAQRVSTAIERVLLYREARRNEQVALHQASQLRRLMEASLAVNSPLSEAQMLTVLADQARRVLGAERAVVSVRTGSGDMAHAGSPAVDRAAPALYLELDALVRDRRGPARGAPDQPPPGAVSLVPRRAWLATPLNDANGEHLGSIVLVGAQGPAFTDGDESILVSMAQMASVAVENSRLYQEIRANGQRLETLMQSSPLAIVELDLDGRATWWNRAARQLLDWPEPPGRAGASRPGLHPEVAEQLSLLWYRAVRGQATLGMEVTLPRSGGEDRQLLLSTAPMHDVDGSVTGIMALLDDVTERKRFEAQINQAERLEAMGRLAGGVAHDFNNLLTVILGYSDMLLRQLDEDDPRREEVESVRRAGKRAAALTSQLLAIGRREMVNPEVVEPAAVVRAMEPMLRSVMGGDVELTLRVDPATGRVLIDPAQLERALLNLAMNARDAMPDGGALTIAVRPGRADEEDLAEPFGGAFVTISVTDSGHGMEPEVQEHCFEPFFTTKETHKGTGLGLAAVHGIVTQAKGYVRVQSAVGRGTTFDLRLPAVVDQPAPAEEEQPRSRRAWGRILLVEDEVELRSLVRRQLEVDGYEVIEAGDGLEALEAMAGAGELDLLLTDVVMPRMKGTELARRVAVERPDLPVLFMSAYSGADKLEDGRLPDDADLLAKPFGPDELSRRVGDAVERGALAQRSNR